MNRESPREVAEDAPEVQPLRLLIVEDSATDAHLVVEELKRTGRRIEFERVDTPAAMRAALEREWDVVVADWTLPDLGGLAALSLLKELNLDLPFIIISATGGEEHAVDAIRAGAHDYVTKDKLGRLIPAVERELLERGTRHARREADLALREAERRMRRMIDSAMVGIWFQGAEGKTSFMNHRMAQILGLSAEEAAHVSLVDFVDDKFRPLLAARLAQRKAGISGNYEQRLRRKDGTVVWGLFDSSPLFDDRARFEGVLFVMTDITEQVKSQHAQREAELRFRSLFDSGIMGVTITDRAGHYIDANNTFLRMVGYSRDDLDSGALSWMTITPAEWRAADGSVHDALTTQGYSHPFEKEYLRKDGTRVPVLVGVAVLDDSRLLTVITDLTDRKLVERANRALEEQLRQAQKMEAVGRLASGVAHDFNNLLSVILSYSQFAIEDLEPGDPLRDDMLQIDQAGKRAAELTRQLLAFSRQQIVEPKVLDLNEVFTRMDKMLKRLVGEDVELTWLPGESLGRVRVDPGSIEQVIMNLAVNARDAMPAGGKLSIETANVILDEDYTKDHIGATPGANVVLSVTDSGTGMDKATMSRIFEPFFTTKEQGKGTGLGLSTVFGIVQQSGGSVWVYSEPGIGTTFKVYLPRVDARADDLGPKVTLTTLRGSETVLLVEDEDQVREVARGILRRHGYMVIEARNAGEALLHCEQHPGRIDLLLTDVVMPQMNGTTLVKRLVQARPEMAVLCMSGYTDHAAIHHGLIDASIAFLQKPLTVEGLTTKVREVLESHRGVHRPTPT